MGEGGLSAPRGGGGGPELTPGVPVLPVPGGGAGPELTPGMGEEDLSAPRGPLGFLSREGEGDLSSPPGSPGLPVPRQRGHRSATPGVACAQSGDAPAFQSGPAAREPLPLSLVSGCRSPPGRADPQRGPPGKTCSCG